MAATDVTLHFGNLCSVTNSRYREVDNANLDVTFRVVSDKTRAVREYSTTVALDITKNSTWHLQAAWNAIMADTAVQTQMVAFVRAEALKPTSNEPFEIIGAV
jgi:transposase